MREEFRPLAPWRKWQRGHCEMCERPVEVVLSYPADPGTLVHVGDGVAMAHYAWGYYFSCADHEDEVSSSMLDKHYLVSPGPTNLTWRGWAREVLYHLLHGYR
jgi:hypothetical protein